MSSTDTRDTQAPAQAGNGRAVRFHPRPHSVRIAYGAAAAAIVPFIVSLVTGTSGAAGFAALLLAAAGALLALHVRGRATRRVQAVKVDDAGVTIERAGSARQIAWSDVAALTIDRIRMSITLATHIVPTGSGRGVKALDAVTFDADLDDAAGFIRIALAHIEAARAADGAAKSATPRPLYARSLREDAVTLSITAAALALGLLVWPPLFIAAVLAFARLAWRSITTPFSVAIDDTGVWVIRPLGSDVIPLRAIRGVHLAAAGRPVGAVVRIDHRDRGGIEIRGLGASAVPLFDGVLAAQRRDRAAQSTGTASRRVGSAVQRSGSRHSALVTCAAGLTGLVAVALITIMTGIPLRNATAQGNTLTARIAMLPGTRLDAAGRDGRTALHIAAALNRADIARALIARGADVDARPGGAGPTPLHEAAGNGHANVTAQLIAAGADVNAGGALERTPLAQAASADAPGDATVVQLLLDAGADPDRADIEGRTALHYAAFNGHAAFVRLLAGAGGNIEAIDSLGHRPLHAAVTMRQQAATAAVLAVGADPDAPGRGGRTALAYAAADKAPLALIAELLDARARVTVTDDDGWNPVQLAATANSLEMLELFARRRVPLDHTDGRVAPALWLAVDAGQTDAVRALLRGGANPRVRWQGRSAVELASSRRNATMLALMRMR